MSIGSDTRILRPVSIACLHEILWLAHGKDIPMTFEGLSGPQNPAATLLGPVLAKLEAESHCGLKNQIQRQI